MINHKSRSFYIKNRYSIRRHWERRPVAALDSIYIGIHDMCTKELHKFVDLARIPLRSVVDSCLTRRLMFGMGLSRSQQGLDLDDQAKARRRSAKKMYTIRWPTSRHAWERHLCT